MPEPEPESVDEPATGDDPELRVTVTRTGGFAGLTRRWCAEPAEAEASAWHDLIARCPWDAADPAAADGAATRADSTPPQPDRFAWNIQVDQQGAPTHHAMLAEQHVEGSWADLIEAVRRSSA